jgi:hypothetical protein
MSSILIEGILFVSFSDINFLILFRNTSLGDMLHDACSPHLIKILHTVCSLKLGLDKRVRLSGFNLISLLSECIYS